VDVSTQPGIVDLIDKPSDTVESEQPADALTSSEVDEEESAGQANEQDTAEAKQTAAALEVPVAKVKSDPPILMVSSLPVSAASKLDLSSLLAVAGDLAHLLHELFPGVDPDAVLDPHEVLRTIVRSSSTPELRELHSRVQAHIGPSSSRRELRPKSPRPVIVVEENPTSFEGQVKKIALEIVEVTDRLVDSELLNTNDLALELVKLANAAQAGDQQQIIKSGTAIKSYVAKLSQEIREIASHCKDDRLKKSLILFATSMRDLSIQLKILCSRKATAPPSQASDTDLQIVSCVRNLSRALTSSVDVISIVESTGMLVCL